jgi:Beta-glucan synthesis-associated protein (SKN1).
MRMGAAAVGLDQGADGSGVGRRLIPEEPMAIVLNLGISGALCFAWVGGS